MLEVPADGTTMGEVMVKGNIVMKGYLSNEQATRLYMYMFGYMYMHVRIYTYVYMYKYIYIYIYIYAYICI
jgi:acyl-CoA synthetase (AMP-forming)/AMP-acid ligase II